MQPTSKPSKSKRLDNDSSATDSSPLTFYKNPLGLCVLHESSSENATSIIVDIVFVYGLGGSAIETWTHASKIFWSMLLHQTKKFSNARILSFSYDVTYVNIFASKNAFEISNFAK